MEGSEALEKLQESLIREHKHKTFLQEIDIFVKKHALNEAQSTDTK